MPEPRPSFHFYAKDWLGSSRVRGLSFAERGLYIDLLAHAWDRPEGLPTDEALLQRLVGADRAEWRKLWPAVRACFQEHDGFLINRKLEHVREDSRQFREAKSKAGKASADARAGKYGSAQPPNTRRTESRTDARAGFRTAAQAGHRTSAGTAAEPVSCQLIDQQQDTQCVCDSVGGSHPESGHTHTVRGDR